jgi:multimeric flavodoxin WrbA
VLDGARNAGAETEIIDLIECRIAPCTACEGCTLTGTCIFDDDVAGIIRRMRDADGIVFGSPVYIDNVTGQMKVFFDRLADAIHYQVLAGKYGCAVATTHESGGAEVVAYLGVISVGGIGMATKGDSGTIDAAEPDARALGRKLADAIRDGHSDPAQEEILNDNREYFKKIVEENRDFRTVEFEEWVKKGWIG